MTECQGSGGGGGCAAVPQGAGGGGGGLPRDGEALASVEGESVVGSDVSHPIQGTWAWIKKEQTIKRGYLSAATSHLLKADSMTGTVEPTAAAISAGQLHDSRLMQHSQHVAKPPACEPKVRHHHQLPDEAAFLGRPGRFLAGDWVAGFFSTSELVALARRFLAGGAGGAAASGVASCTASGSLLLGASPVWPVSAYRMAAIGSQNSRDVRVPAAFASSIRSWTYCMPHAAIFCQSGLTMRRLMM